jgi:integrase
MTVRKRGKTYMVDVSDGHGGRIRKMVGSSRSVAELVEQDLKVKIAKQVHLGIYEAVNMTFEEYTKQWMERKKKKVSLSTARDYQSTMDVYAIPHFGKIPMARIAARDAENFLDRLGNLSGKRKNNIMVPIKCLFNDAKRRKDITENPFAEIGRFREEKVFIDPFSIPEMRLFLENVDKDFLPYFFTCFFTGMRPNELIALKWVNVDLDHLAMISVKEGRVQGIEGPPKTDSSYRDIDILPPLMEVLRKHRVASPPGAHYVFTGQKGAPLDVNNLRNRVWYPTLDKCGLRRRTMYQTRHTFASLMLYTGEDPLWVARMLGHTSTEMLYRHYGKYIRNRMRKDGGRFLQGLQDAGWGAELPALPTPDTSTTRLKQ